MRNVTLFIAMSLDGYIADAHGGVAWLGGEATDAEMPDTYSAFIRDIDTVIMGWNTYHQIITELSPGEWAYPNLQTYVLTHRQEEGTEDIRFTDEPPCSLLRRLKHSEGRGIWICGGADTVCQLLQEGMIDTFHISVIPVLLGSGIRLFDAPTPFSRLHLVRTAHYNGIAELVYQRPEYMLS